MPNGDVLNQAEINKPINNNVEKSNKLRNKLKISDYKTIFQIENIDIINKLFPELTP